MPFCGIIRDMKCRCESSQGIDSSRLRHGTASRTSIFGDCPHLHPKTYRYGYLDKVLSVAEGKDRRTFTYHVDGQLATATNGKETEDFLWDGLALIRRGSTAYVTPRLSKNNPSQQAWYGLKKNCSHYI